MAEISDLNTTDANNTARFPENQAPSSVNDGARALEGLLARWASDFGDGFVTTGGTSTAFTAASNRTISAYYDGLTLMLEFHTAAGATPTLNVDSVGAQSLVWPDGTAISSDLPAGLAIVIYDVTNTNWVVLTVPGAPGLANVVEDTTPQLGGQLDVNGNAIGDGTLELLSFVETGSAVNHVQITNAATGNGPLIDPAGDDTNVDLLLKGKGTGKLALGDAGLKWPDSDGTANQIIETDGSGVLSFVDKPTGSGPSFFAHKNGTNQTSVSSGSETKVTFGTEDWDTDSDFASSTFTPSTAGKYRLTFACEVTASSGMDQNDLELIIYKNGSAHRRVTVTPSGADNGGGIISVLVDANGSTDNFEAYVLQTSTVNGTVLGDTEKTWFCGELARAA